MSKSRSVIFAIVAAVLGSWWGPVCGGFIKELRYRNVFRVAIAYIVAGWLVAQATDLAADALNAPDWVMQMLIVGLLIYTHFDAAPYPNLTQRLEEQRVMRHDVTLMNFACQR